MNQGNFLCEKHEIMKCSYCKICVDLFCVECEREHIHSVQYFPEDLKLSYIFYKFVKTSPEINVFLVKRIESNQFYLLYLFNEKYDDFYKTQLKEKLFFIAHPNISKFLYKWQRSRILAEAYDKSLILTEKTLIEIIPEILNIFDYLHTSLGIYHGDFSQNCLKIKFNRLFLIGIMYGITPKERNPATIYQYQKKDLENLRKLIEKTLKNQANIQEIHISDDNPLKFVYLKLLECEKNNIKPSISELKSLVFKENPQKLLRFIEEPRSRLLNNKISNKSDLSSLAIMSNFDKIQTIKLAIANEKEGLSSEFEKKAFEFQHLMQKTLLRTRVQVLNIRINPSFVLVNSNDNWRTFWWYAFYQKPLMKKKDQRTKISLRLQSKNDWYTSFLNKFLLVFEFF